MNRKNETSIADLKPLLITADTPLTPFLALPRFLIASSELNSTEKILYTMLLDRARMSQSKQDWADEYGNIYIIYPIKQAARDMGRSEMCIKSAMTSLEHCGLIFRQRTRAGLATRIYVKLPHMQSGGKAVSDTERNASPAQTENCPSHGQKSVSDTDGKLSPAQTENCPSHGQKTVSDTDGKLSPSNNKGSNNKRSNNKGSNNERTAYGMYANVMLSDEELSQLQRDVPNYREYIERVSSYMRSSGKRYDDHAATIRSWYMRDNPKGQKRSYECTEDESL